EATTRGLEAEDAVGEILVRPFTLAGRFVGDEIRARTIAFDASDLSRVPVRIAVAGGTTKVRPVLGALRSGVVTILVTDRRTAEAVLALDAAGGDA
ncbi:MAG TPA: sugar-binding domain-containing protein, partial [Candidatus Limnocylindrales bacterium]|nr:sugar-binding domain-containing protein [Candidatus Limnocylindrales bacterium]